MAPRLLTSSLELLMPISLQVNRLRAASCEKEFALHRAAIEWDLDSSLSINDPSDIESRRHWSDRLEPFEHQIRNLITFCRRAPVALIADDVGLGKTISAGLILSELFTRRKIRRALVLCPKILLPQWKEELETKFGIPAEHLVGTQLTYALRSTREGVLITTYDSARDRMEAIRTAGFDALILDEAHKLRNLHGSNKAKAPKFATAVRAALADRVFKYVVMLTATPVKNRLWDLYSLIDCLTVAKGHRNPLGSRAEFASRYLSGTNGTLQLNSGRREEFRRILADYMVRTRRGDAHLQFPERNVRTAAEAAADAEARLIGLVGQAMAGLSGFMQISVAQALMSSPEALLAQLENMREGASPQLIAAARDLVRSDVLTSKMRRLIQVLDELRSQSGDAWRAVVFTTRKETQKAIGTRLEAKGLRVGYIRGAQALANDKAIKGFWKDPPDVNVLVSTDTGAEGVNLQVGNVVVNYDLPWDPMVVEQRIGRVQRLKSKFSHVVVVNLTVAGSVEERVVARLLEKLQLISHTVGDVEAILESVSDKNGDEGAFEETIQKLVVQALMGANVERDLRMAAESIERAKKIYEDERQVVDTQLGDLDGLHRTGPRMPKLTKIPPSMTVQDFVFEALKAVGGQITPAGGAYFRASLPGRAPFLFTFDESAEGGPGGILSAAPIRVYAEGRPDFTRLVGEWTKRSEHHVSLGLLEASCLEGLAERWCGALADARLKSVKALASKPHFQGRLLCRVAASVAHDRYEKLVEIGSSPEGHASLELAALGSQATLSSDEFEPAGCVAGLESRIEAAGVSDTDIGAFERFYRERLAEELKATVNQPDLERRVRDSFEPTLAAEVVGAAGVTYDEATIRLELQLGAGSYAAELQVVPLLGQILREPARACCQVTNQRVPEQWLERCSFSGKMALKHLLAESAESGQRALRQYLVPCPLTGALVLQSELETSPVSGRQGRSSLFASSAVSGQRALQSELVTCDFTGVPVLPAELATSEVSGRQFRRDQACRSEVSGKVGHLSEFNRCSVTGAAVLADETNRSAVSGRIARADLLRASEKPPHRLALPDEFVRCARTGKMLLSDEVIQSSVSGVVADKDLAVRSQASGRWALVGELVTCEETQVSLLPSEVSRCSLGGKTVDARLLVRSAVSGAFALERLMERCASTGQLALPPELAPCEITGQRVLTTQLETCSITGKRALRSRLVQSAVSGVYLLPEKAVRSGASGKWCAPNEVVRCTWTHAVLLPQESRICSLTGLRFDGRLVNASGEFVPLRELLDGEGGGQLRPDLVAWVKEDPERKTLHGARAVWALPSPTGDALAACVEIRSLLGLRVRHAGLVAKDGPSRKILGRCLAGRRTASGWTPEGEA